MFLRLWLAGWRLSHTINLAEMSQAPLSLLARPPSNQTLVLVKRVSIWPLGIYDAWRVGMHSHTYITYLVGSGLQSAFYELRFWLLVANVLDRCLWLGFVGGSFSRS